MGRGRRQDGEGRPARRGHQQPVAGADGVFRRDMRRVSSTRENAMAEHATPATCGVDHVGLSVRDLTSTCRFFCDCLGWRVVGERPDYPAAFVSDGQLVVTLWQVEAPNRA